MSKMMTPVEVWKCLEKDLLSLLVYKLLEGCECLRRDVLVLIKADMQRTRDEDIRGTAHVRSSGGKAEGPD